MSGRSRNLAIAFAIAHTLLLAAYTLPGTFVPSRPRYWSQAYARVLFHQDWRLFAPDPPSCSCALEVQREPNGAWIDLRSLRRHFIWRRMVANACRYAEASPRTSQSDTIRIPTVLSVSLEKMARMDTDHVPSLIGMRLRRSCAVDDFEVFVIHPDDRR